MFTHSALLCNKSLTFIPWARQWRLKLLHCHHVSLLLDTLWFDENVLKPGYYGETNEHTANEVIFMLVIETNIIFLSFPYFESSFVWICNIFLCTLYRGWLSYVPPAALALLAAYMAYVRHMRNNNNEPIKEVVVSTPPNQSTVEQLLALQQALSQLESLIQAGNIFLLKTRALILSALPEVSY